MPTHLLHSGNEQAIAFLAVIAVAVAIRFWHIVLTTFALLVIVAALIVFSVLLDLHVVHEVATYLRNLVHEITGLIKPWPRRRSSTPVGGHGLFMLTAPWQRHGPLPGGRQADRRDNPAGLARVVTSLAHGPPVAPAPRAVSPRSCRGRDRTLLNRRAGRGRPRGRLPGPRRAGGRPSSGG